MRPFFFRPRFYAGISSQALRFAGRDSDGFVIAWTDSNKSRSA